MLTIAQITDLHVTSAADAVNGPRNEARLRQVLATIHRLRPRPVAIVASGDLVDTGSSEEYARLSAILGEAEIPIYLVLGNHDRRAPLLKTFNPPLVAADEHGFVQYAVDLGALRLVVCDTVEEGESDGAFCDTRANWLARTLDAAPSTPTIVVLHHPPVACGIEWMDPQPGADWIARLEAVLVPRTQVATALCGHVHRHFHTMFGGHPLSVSAATALQLTLDLSPIDRRLADGRQILVGEPPGFTLLCWDGLRLITHHAVAGEFPDQITYDRPFAVD